MKSFIISIGLLLTISLAKAQTKLTKADFQKDSIIKADIIDPAIHEAQGEAPDWSGLTAEITQKYDAIYADRNIMRNQIFFYFGKDWFAFNGALVKYTEKYEPKDNLNLLNKNARMVLKYSNDKKELTVALGWSKHTVDIEPANADYKKTFEALTAKIAGN